MNIITKFIIVAFGYILPGFFAGASQIDTPEVKEASSIEQASEVESNETKRNGFFDVGLAPRCSFYFYGDSSGCDFNLALSTQYGKVFGKSALADAGVLEGKVIVNGNYSSVLYNIGAGFAVDVNFIKNDGINRIIPGLHLEVLVGYQSKGKIDITTYSLVGGVVLKVFVSKQLAIVPSLATGFVRSHTTEVTDTRNTVIVSLNLGLRSYF